MCSASPVSAQVSAHGRPLRPRFAFRSAIISSCRLGGVLKSRLSVASRMRSVSWGDRSSPFFFGVFTMANPPIPVPLRITAHATPHPSDPPDAHEFYTALGQFTVAWGRFEGHFSGALLMILAMPEAAPLLEPLPISWKKRASLWRRAFNTLPSLAPRRDLALRFIERVMQEISARHLGAHGIWDEFETGAPEPTIPARSIKAKKGQPGAIEVADYRVTLSAVRSALQVVNAMNWDLSKFTTGFLDSLRPPPPAGYRP